jgi:hypothetical protein
LRRAPQPDVAPFFVKRAQDEGLLEANNGVTSVTPSSEGMNGWKRRGSVSPLRYSEGYIPILPMRQSGGMWVAPAAPQTRHAPQAHDESS